MVDTDKAANKSHVLLVEDDLVSAEAVQRALTRASLRISVAPDGMSALDIHDNDPADLVLLDLRLPDMHGTDVALDLHSRNPGLPIVVVTGFSSRELNVNFAVTAVLQKPLDLTQLKEICLKALLNGRQASSQGCEAAD